MINVKELRIGNWVICNGKHKEVKCISKNGIFIEGKSAIFEPYPIPLSPDILLACGFKKLSSAWFEKDDIKILLGYTEQYGDFWHLCTFDELVIGTSHKYLHELQNIWYFLQGEELNYKPI